MKLISHLRFLIESQSRPRGQAMDKIRDTADTFAHHCALLFLFPKDLSANHWSREIYGYLKDFRLKSRVKGGKQLSKGVLVHLLYEEPAGDTEQCRDLLEVSHFHQDFNKDTQPYISIAEIQKFQKQFEAFTNHAIDNGFMLSPQEILKHWRNND